MTQSAPTSLMVPNVYGIGGDTVSIMVTTTTTTYTQTVGSKTEVFVHTVTTTPEVIYTQIDAELETDIYTLYTFGSNANG